MTTKTASTDYARAAIEAKEQQQQQQPSGQPATTYRKVELMLEQLKPQIERALPNIGVDVERFNRITLTAMRLNPGLMADNLNIPSFFGAVMQAAQLGLEPGLLNHCHFIPYEDKKNNVTVVSFQIGYKGYIDLVTRSGEVKFIMANPVYKGDIFRAIHGTTMELYHEQTWQSDEITHFYAYAKLANGETVFKVMSIEAINRIRDEHSSAYKGAKKWDKEENSVWVKHYEAMAAKTCIKQLVKYLPISTDIHEKIAYDETVKKNLEDDPQYIDIQEFTEQPA